MNDYTLTTTKIYARERRGEMFAGMGAKAHPFAPEADADDNFYS